jgi:spore coat polysaccharide biosynthesis protein SpsF (cytidylyltransferase family)
MKDFNDINKMLELKIIDNCLVIRIWIDTLAWATEHSEKNEVWDEEKEDYVNTVKIKDNLQFAKDVMRELSEEEEDGTTMVHLLLDNATEKAIENGSLGLDVK